MILKTKLITIPTFRQDLVGMCDIAEEVARFYMDMITFLQLFQVRSYIRKIIIQIKN